jgi:O-antigen ligase/tetratricopeptide (TPR) repeat protein
MQLYLQRFIIFLIAIMPLLTPIRPDIGWINAAPELFKTAWGVSTVLIALTWWTFNQYKAKQLEIIKTPLYLPIWGFVVWSFITLFWVEDGYLATIMLAQFTSSALIFTLIINSFKNYDLVVKIPKALVISMTIVTIIGLMQYYNPDNYFIQNFFAQAAKPASTFGNKNMASHFVVMVLPLSIVFLLSAKNNFVIARYSVVVILGFWYLMNAAARQAWVAMAVELTVLLAFVILDRYKYKEQAFIKSDKQIKNKFVAIVGIILSLVFVANVGTEGSFHRGSEKLEFVKKIDVEGISSRFPAWVNTIEMIKEHPITGVGVGQWPESYPLYYDRAMKDTFFDERVHLQKVHNDYLEILANFGLIGYALLLWLVYLIITNIWVIFKNHHDRNRLLVLGLSLGLIGFSVIALVSFPVRVYLPAFLVLVYFSIIVLSVKPISEFDLIKYKLSKNVLTLMLVVSSVFAIFIIIMSNRWILAEYHYSNANTFRILNKNDLQDLAANKLNVNELQVKASLRALKYNNFSPKFYISAAEGLIKMGHAETAILYLKKAIDISPFNTRSLLVLARIYRSGASVEDLKQERKILEFVLSFDSKNVKALSYLVRSLAEEGRSKDATIVYHRMKNNFEYFKGRRNFGPYHKDVGFVAVSVGDHQYAQYIYQDAIKDYPTAINYINLGMVEFDLLKNKDKGIEMYKKALLIEPNVNVSAKIKKIINKYESSARQ